MSGMSVGERIKAARKERNMTQKDLGTALGVSQSVVSEMEAGKLKNWPLHANAIVHLLGKPRSYFEPEPAKEPAKTVSVVPIVKDLRRRIPVVGDVQAGVWLEAVAREYYEFDEHVSVDVSGYETAALKAMRVLGPSMNRVFPPGRYVVLAEPAEAGVRSGDMVVIERRNNGLVEITLKEYVEEEDGRIALWPRSDHPDFQTPIYLRERNELDQDGLRIVGVVVAEYARYQRPPLSR
jgi:transcriptional regulator with XRE-family HTH domain